MPILVDRELGGFGVGRQDVFKGLACLLFALGEHTACAEEAQDATDRLWRKPDDERLYSCTLVAQADSTEQLNELRPQGEFRRLAELGKFDFVGTVEQVPFRKGCGEVWVGGCPGGRFSNQWIKIRAGACGIASTATGTSTKINTNTITSLDAARHTASHAAPAVSASVSVSPNRETSSITDTNTGTETAVSTGTGTSTSTSNGKSHDASEARANAVVTKDPGATPDLSCGQPEEENGKPEVTKWMKEAAEGIEELEGKFNRSNHYSTLSMSAEGNPEERGGEEVDEKAKNEGKMLRDFGDDKNREVFVLIAGREISHDAIDAVAVVSHEGFSRDITTLFMVFGIHEYGYFHGDAGSLDMAQERAARLEREKQLALAGALGIVLAKLQQGKIITFKCDAHKNAIPIDDLKMPEPPPPCDVPIHVVDQQGIANTQAYIALAQQRARNLSLITCQLLRLRDVNAERQYRQASLSDMATETVGPGSKGASRPVRSTIQGGGDPFALPPPGLHLGNSPQTEIADPTSWKDELLSPFGPPLTKEEESSDSKSATKSAPSLEPELESEMDLFLRVHKKYRSLDSKNRFPRSILD